jgi:hypothetical protein
MLPRRAGRSLVAATQRTIDGFSRFPKPQPRSVSAATLTLVICQPKLGTLRLRYLNTSRQDRCSARLLESRSSCEPRHKRQTPHQVSTMSIGRSRPTNTHPLRHEADASTHPPTVSGPKLLALPYRLSGWQISEHSPSLACCPRPLLQALQSAQSAMLAARR